MSSSACRGKYVQRFEQFRMPRKNLRATRANRVFQYGCGTSVLKNTVMDKSSNGLGLSLYKIADCARTDSSSAHNRRSARTGRRPRKF
jgi:hypothetical protein